MDNVKTLDFEKIQKLVSDKAVTKKGKVFLENAVPKNTYSEVEMLLEQTDEAYNYIENNGTSPIIRYSDVSDILPKIKVNSVLTFGELLKMASFIHATGTASKISDFGKGYIFSLAEGLVYLEDIEKEIVFSIVSENEMADNASPQLAAIRRKIKILSDSIKDKLNNVLRSLEQTGMLQESIITMRNDRYVLPVLASNKSKVPGIVHDQSSSGATLFIEPMAVVEINNDIRKLHLDERDEIERIITDLSQRLNVYYEALESNETNLTALDIIFARAKFAREINAVKPVLNDKLYVSIVRGRHPLIDKKKVVPTTVYLGDKFTQLLITGPNTGGKTVTLKTVGLFAMMTQCGMFLPAEIGTTMPVFDKIFADIGDEQSIQQSLSTFSSHMKNISLIMKNVTANSLVLLDELGAGTDPTEGAALAMSILEELRRRRIRTVVTSHYAELKAYSIEKSGAENASVEFDTNSLKPTYKLLVGVPGNSNAFLISSKLGLEKYLIDRARSYVDEDSRQLSKVLTNAEAYRASAKEKKSKADQILFEMNTQKQRVENETKKLEKQRELIIEKANKEAENIRKKALEEANEIIENMKKLSSQIDDSAIFKAREQRKKLKKEEKKETVNIVGEKIREFTVGMDVYSPEYDQDGTVAVLPNSKGKVKVNFGAIQVEIDKEKLVYSKKQLQTNKGGIKVNRVNHNFSSSIDVRGQLADEAIVNVEMYLDCALANNMGSVTIIHGKGTGALKKAIGEYLKSNRNVSSFRAGAYGEGDYGVTVVELKK